MTPIRIYFYKGEATFFDRLIRWWTHSPYSHCAVVITEDGGVDVLFEAMNDIGVRSRVVVPEIDLRPSQWDHLDIPASPASGVEVDDWCVSELGCGYDWSGLFWSQVLRIPREHPRKWFCSEFAAAALKRLGMLAGKEPCTFSPGSLYRTLTAGHA